VDPAPDELSSSAAVAGKSLLLDERLRPLIAQRRPRWATASTWAEAAVELAKVVLEALAVEANEASREDLVALKRDEDGVAREDSVGKQENCSHHPDGIGTKAYACRTLLTNEVGDLR
jgi:hypothetical protein